VAVQEDGIIAMIERRALGSIPFPRDPRLQLPAMAIGRPLAVLTNTHETAIHDITKLGPAMTTIDADLPRLHPTRIGRRRAILPSAQRSPAVCGTLAQIATDRKTTAHSEIDATRMHAEIPAVGVPIEVGTGPLNVAAVSATDRGVLSSLPSGSC
jgi:hypothetical protein